MLDSEKLDYGQWKIPARAWVCLVLLQLEDLDIIHRWKSQIDISYLTSKAIQHPSLAERQRRFQEGVPPVFAIRRITDQQLLGEISLYNLNPKNRSVGVCYFTGPEYRRQGYTKEGL
jgi:ribosomal-protein-alanine N-acetyltransferase